MSPTAVVQRRVVADIPRDVLVTGGTGYIGQALVVALLERGHRVRVLTRPSSAQRVPAGAEPVVGDALDAKSVKSAIRPNDTIIHLVGTPHPGPGRTAEFERVDLGSIRATVDAVRGVGTSHLIYVSVAQPAPVMQAYVAARAAGEAVIASAGVRSTILRPWYVVGPGHWWPVLLKPLYALASLVPGMRDGARRLGLVTHEQMVRALVRAVERPAPKGMTILDVPMIRQATLDGKAPKGKLGD
jgi:uncharacterized protein YbjT (DUF2867 family)